MLCSKLHCQKDFNWILLLYKIACTLARSARSWWLSHRKCVSQKLVPAQIHLYIYIYIHIHIYTVTKHTVRLFFILVIVKDKSTDLYGNWLLHNDFMNNLCEMSVEDDGITLSELIHAAWLICHPGFFRLPPDRYALPALIDAACLLSSRLRVSRKVVPAIPTDP